jgi:hypothetical protein
MYDQRIDGFSATARNARSAAAAAGPPSDRIEKNKSNFFPPGQIGKTTYGPGGTPNPALKTSNQLTKKTDFPDESF